MGKLVALDTKRIYCVRCNRVVGLVQDGRRTQFIGKVCPECGAIVCRDCSSEDPECPICGCDLGGKGNVTV